MKDITGREYIYGLAQDKNGAPYLFNIGELVRCKDCRYWHSNTEFCGIWSFNFQNIAQRTLRDDYCSRAERREE